MPEFNLDIGDDHPRWNKLSDFVSGYIEAAAFCGCEPPEGHPLKDRDSLQFSFGALYHATVRQMAKDCERFQDKAKALLDQARERGLDDDQLGQDFWFTRNGHGVGYGFREELQADGLGDALSEIADSFGQRDLYMTEHGRVGQG